jgi:beta-glucosidase
LKGFRKLRLAPGETTVVVLELRTQDLRGYDEAGGWTLTPGRYEVLVGASSRDLRLRSTVYLA